MSDKIEGASNFLDQIKLEYIVKYCAYIFFELREDYKDNLDIFVKYCEENAAALKDQELLREYNIIFDETLWIPDKPEAYNNIMRIYIKLFPSHNYYSFQFDFSKNINDGVFQVYDNQLHHLGIFN